VVFARPAALTACPTARASGLLIRARRGELEMVVALGYRIRRLVVGRVVAAPALAGLGGRPCGPLPETGRRDRGIACWVFIVRHHGGLASVGGLAVNGRAGLAAFDRQH